MESEYMSANAATKEAVWIQNVVHTIRSQFTDELLPRAPVRLYIDNKAAIKVAKNPEFYSKSKHIDIDHHFIRQRVELGQIALEYISTTDMVADYLTKSLSAPKHEACRTATGILPPN